MDNRPKFNEKVCEICGEPYTPTSGAQRYCNICRKIRRKEVSAAFKQRTKESSENIQCCICGGKFGEMIHGKPYCWNHRARFYKYGSFELPEKQPTSGMEIDGEVLIIVTAKSELIIADAEDIDLLKSRSWRLTECGYAVTGSGNSLTYMHRLVMRDNLHDGEEIDHANGNPADNRKANLRVCQHRENSRNLDVRKNNTSGYPGVWENGYGKYRAAIMVDYKQIYLGTYSTFEEAVEARRKAEDKYHGQFAGHIRREQSKN